VCVCVCVCVCVFSRCAWGWGQWESRGIRRFPACMGMNVAGITQGWIQQLQDFHRDGFYYGENPAGMH